LAGLQSAIIHARRLYVRGIYHSRKTCCWFNCRDSRCHRARAARRFSCSDRYLVSVRVAPERSVQHPRKHPPYDVQLPALDPLPVLSKCLNQRRFFSTKHAGRIPPQGWNMSIVLDGQISSLRYPSKSTSPCAGLQKSKSVPPHQKLFLLYSS